MNRTKAKVCLGVSGLLVFMMLLSGCDPGLLPIPLPIRFPAQGPHFLYVVNSISTSISGFSIDSTSGALTSVGPAVPTGDGSIYAVATENGKFLYVANAEEDASNVSAYRINPKTGVLTPTTPATFPVTGDGQPFGIVVDPSSTHVYTANAGSISAFRIDPITGNLSNVPGTPVSTGNVEPQNLTLTPNGQFLYVTYGLTNQVAAYTLNSAGLPQAKGRPVATGEFPIGIVVDPGGRFAYVANWISNDVSRYVITPGTGVLVPAGTTSVGAGCEPQELVVDPSARFLYVTCPGLSNIAQFAINPQSGALTAVDSPLATGLATEPRGIAVDASGKFVYSALNTANRIGVAEIGLTGTLKLTTDSPGTKNGPLGVAIANPQSDVRWGAADSSGD